MTTKSQMTSEFPPALKVASRYWKHGELNKALVKHLHLKLLRSQRRTGVAIPLVLTSQHYELIRGHSRWVHQLFDADQQFNNALIILS